METVQSVEVFKVGMAHPTDLAGVVSLVEAGALDLRDLVAVIGKTEGTGEVDDPNRAACERALTDLLVMRAGLAEGEVAARVPIVLSGGCAGVLSPHLTLFCRRRLRATAPGDPRLVIGTAMSEPIPHDEIGRMGQIQRVARAVTAALADAGLSDPGAARFVQVKNPALTTARIAALRERGVPAVSDDPATALMYSCDAAALGVAVALGEIAADRLSDAVVRRDFSLYSRVASASAGGEKTRAEVIVLGNARASTSPFRVGHAVLRDLVDADGVRTALRDAGLGFEALPGPAEQARIVNVFAKAIVPGHGTCRGRRFCMLKDRVLGTKPARAIVNAVIASVTGDPMNFVSGGEVDSHQGPPDGMPCAAIVRVA